MKYTYDFNVSGIKKISEGSHNYNSFNDCIVYSNFLSSLISNEYYVRDQHIKMLKRSSCIVKYR